ncbi:MAG: hypothetical protein K2X93_12255 [Candidatus Obscuribacterales bacterium]|nr:hypothetical protein [Candidatus Obscuribacterales bacterium]
MTELSNKSSGSGDEKSNSDFWQGLFNATPDEPRRLEMQKGAPSQAAPTNSSSESKSAYRKSDGKTRKVAAPKKHGSRSEKQVRTKKQAKQHNFRDTTKRIGFNPTNQASPIGQTDTYKTSDAKSYFRPGFMSMLFGAVLPVAALVIETNTHEMARQFFDPFPTIFHIFLFLLIPISTTLTWLATRLNLSPLYSMMSLASGMALGISVLYTLMLAPLAPMFIGLLLPYGTGLLGLSPLLSIPVILLCGGTICKLADRHPTFFDAHQLKHLGHLIILVMVVAVELPSTLTRAQLAEATQPGPKAGDAIAWLRKWGSRDVLLRACYERSGEATDILGSLVEHQHPVRVEQARDLYYKVTGVAFNTVPIPASFRGTIKNAGLIDDPAGLNADVKDEFDLDPDIAGELVSGVARGLSVSNSTISGNLDGSAGLASLDWDFTFENVSPIAREARANILLPPNAVVSRATLWLDEVRKETVIQERNEARQTYQQAVMQHKRDPLLVSMSGKDSVLVQCYPVAKGTKTRIRLHIVAPMVVTDNKEAAVVLPTFEERNFAIPIQHKIALEGKTEISIAGIGSGANESKVANASIDNSLLGRFAAIPHVGLAWGESPATLTMRPPDTPVEARQVDYFALPDGIFRAGATARDFVKQQNLQEQKHLTIIVDKSITMAPYINEIVDGLATAPDNLNVTLVQVKDGEELLLDARTPRDQRFKLAIDKLKTTACVGGQIDSNALISALSSLGRRDQILWIHAAQPLSENSAYLNMQLRGRSLKLHDLQVASGPNVILNESYRCPGVTRVVRVGNLSQDINVFLHNVANGTIRRSATTNGYRGAGENTELAQLQAYKLAVARFQNGDLAGAFEIANRYHLVTPVSSAVVTEDVDLSKVQEEVVEEKTSKDLSSKAAEVLGSLNSFGTLGPVCEDAKRQVTDVGIMTAGDTPADEGHVSAGTVPLPPPQPVSPPLSKEIPRSRFGGSLQQTKLARLAFEPSKWKSGKLNAPQSRRDTNFYSSGSGGGFGDAYSSQSSAPAVGNNEYYSGSASTAEPLPQAESKKKEAYYDAKPMSRPESMATGTLTPTTPPVLSDFRTKSLESNNAKQEHAFFPRESVTDKLTSLSAASSVSGSTNGTIGPQSGDESAQMKVNDSYYNTGDSPPQQTGNSAEGFDQIFGHNDRAAMCCDVATPRSGAVTKILWSLLFAVGVPLSVLCFIGLRLYSMSKRETLKSPTDWNK